MNNYREQVAAAIQATVFHSPTTYSWFGKLSERLPSSVKRALTPQTARNYLLFSLQLQLYSDFYCRGFAAPAKQETPGTPRVGMTPFVQELSAANAGSGYWEGGWEVRAIKDSRVVVRRGDLELWAYPDDYLVPQGSLIVPGMQLSLGFPKEFLGITPGFYMALSDKEMTEDDSQGLVRFYWNVTAEGAIQLMRSVTWMLNRANMPFKLKVLNDPARYTRCDAAVLYIRKSDYDTVSILLHEIYPVIAANLRQAIPAFTRPLTFGVGLAEDPGQGDSFGSHRCQILAEGMLRAYEQRRKLANERLQIVEDHFAEHGIDLDKPFLNAGSCDIYNFHPPDRQQARPSRKTRPGQYLDAKTFLQTADEIGRHLSHEAVWSGDRCNWLGALPKIRSHTGRQAGATYSTLGPELYSGTSGVALFLAELYKATGDAIARRTALGAIRQALSRAEALPPPSRLGYYSGSIGVALATARVGTILDEEGLLHRAAQLLEFSMRECCGECGFDLLSGSAGAIIALIALCNILNNASLLEFAVKLGDELLQTADKSDIGYSWKSSASPTQHNLTGYSHGAAGIGCALLELFHVTDNSQYRTAAEQAFSYERHWFDAKAGNWPDFREESSRGKRYKRQVSFSTSWCHGAPGIALSRLRAYEIVKDKQCKAEAMTALHTTYQMVEASLHSGIGNYSLCHGLAGNAEALFEGSQVLGQECADASALAFKVANIGIEMYAKQSHLWPCGVGGGETPSLMLGLAGIGYFYLRLYNATVPSILILRPSPQLQGDLEPAGK